MNRMKKSQNYRYLKKNEERSLFLFVNQVKSLLKDNLVAIKLFGSKARGDFDKESDIDVLIIVYKREWTVSHYISGIVTELNLRYDCNIAPIIYTDKEYQKNNRFKTLFAQNLEKEAIAL